MKPFRLLIAFSLLAVACGGCFLRYAPPAPVSNATYIYPPFPIYQKWLMEVEACAVGTSRIDSSFTIERLLEAVDSVVWIAVPTERSDGRFQAPSGKFFSGMRIGPVGADTIFLSGQGLWSERLVKHELLHIIVASPTEDLPQHGRPWGLCEFV